MKTSLLLLAGLACLGQAPAQDKLLPTVKLQAHNYARLLLRGQYAKVVDLTHPPVVELFGGKEKMIRFLERRDEGMKGPSLKPLSIEAALPKEIHKAGKSLVALVPVHSRFRTRQGEFVRTDHLLASSADDGKTWTFADTELVDRAVDKIYPGLPKTFALPAPGKIVEDTPADKPGVFTAVRANFKVTYPKGWKRLFGEDMDQRLTLEKDGQTILLIGHEGEQSAEEIVDDILRRFERFGKKGPDKKAIKVAGVPATLLRIEDDFKEKREILVAIFEHQGIAYQIVGVAPKGKAPDLDKDFHAILNGLSFLAERKEWLAKHEGKPARTAFLAGLASIELNRPRWQEVTFDEPAQHRPMESMRFMGPGRRAWINVWAWERKSTPKAELDSLQQYYAQRLQKFQAKRVLLKGAKDLEHGLEMTGEDGLNSLSILGTVFVKDQLAVHLTLECKTSQRSQFQKDWEQLLREFRLDTKAERLFPLGDRNFDRQASHPRLTALLQKAAVVFPGNRLYQVHSISPDGQQALVQNQQGGWTLHYLADHKEVPLFGRGGPSFGVPAAWSRNGKQLAFATFRGFMLHNLDAKRGGEDEIPIRVSSLAFLPDNNLLLAALPKLDDDMRGSSLGMRFIQQRLLRHEEGEEPKTLLEFPLARFAHLAVSPDGKQLALVTNKDSRRTSARPGHLCVAGTEGADLRQLTKEAENIRSVAWSDDGRFLYIVRRLVPDKERRLEDRLEDRQDFLPGDVYRITVETGEAVNLTRCGLIDQVWVQGDHLLLRISAPQVPLSQNGIFKVSLSDLAKVTASWPTPSQAEPREQARKIAAKIKAAFAPRRLKEVVPTPEILDKLAATFAEAASEALGEPFDFSAASLDRLPHWAEWLETVMATEPELVFGLGAYYGECLRKVAKAEWRLQPLSFGDWLAGRPSDGNSTVQVVLPFSEIYRFALRGRMDYLRTGDMALRSKGQKIVLVYPPAHADEALRQATPKDYSLAQQALDKGEVKIALKLLSQELQKSPHNLPLAFELLELCELVKDSTLADQITRQAVEAGSDAPELLLRHANVLAKTDPKKALGFYRKAAQGLFPPASVYLKLADHLASLGQQSLADCCYRRAYNFASDQERMRIRQALGMLKFQGFPRD